MLSDLRAALLSGSRRHLHPAPTAIGAALVVTLVGGTATAASGGLHVFTPSHHVHRMAPATHQAATPPTAPTSTVDASTAQRPAAILHGATAPSTTSPVVAPLRHLTVADIFITSRKPLSHAAVRAARRVSGVRAVTTIGLGHATVDGYRAAVAAVDPSTFRAFTPALSARSNPLWRSVARGELTASFDMGHNAKLPLGGTIPVHRSTWLPMRVGAFASVGLPGVDAIVSPARGRQLGLPTGNALLISDTKHADPLAVRDALKSQLPTSAVVHLLTQVIVVRDAGEYMTRTQIATILKAASSRLGKPYVWGATGPNSFDCSGLVQWSFAHAGIAMPRTAAEQFLTGPHIPLADARPGDLLFWHYDPTDPTFVDHVAIYVGNGLEIVAPHTGAFVSVQPVPLANLAGVVRVHPIGS